MHRFRYIVVFPSAVDAHGHHVPRHRARGIEVFARKAFADDVAIRHHTDQPIIFPDRNATDIVSLHQFRDFGDGSIGADPIDSLVHYVLDSHGGPPLQHSAPCRSTIQWIGSDRTSASMAAVHGGLFEPSRRHSIGSA